MTDNDTVQSQVAIVDTADATDATLAASNKGSTLWDSTSSVKSSSTIYYDQTQSGSIRNYRNTSTSEQSTFQSEQGLSLKLRAYELIDLLHRLLFHPFCHKNKKPLGAFPNSYLQKRTVKKSN